MIHVLNGVFFIAVDVLCVLSALGTALRVLDAVDEHESGLAAGRMAVFTIWLYMLAWSILATFEWWAI